VTEPAATPAWLLQPQFGLCPCGCIGRRRKGNFVAKTLNGAATLTPRSSETSCTNVCRSPEETLLIQLPDVS